MTDKTAAQILAEAADVIERNGWVQGRYYDFKQYDRGTPAADCRVCLLGGINIAMWGNPSYPRADRRPAFYFQMTGELEKTVGSAWVDDWNDAVGRTVEEVIALLRTTAERIDF